MSDLDLVERYVGVWNEANADARRERIRALWAPDGITSYRLLVARGYEAIEARVTGSWDKWLRDGNYIFRSKNYDRHHDAIKFDWVMSRVSGGAVEAAGRSFLVLNSGGRILADYQFNPSVDEVNERVERYVAVFNEPNAAARRRGVAELWTQDGAFISEPSVRNGHDAITAWASDIHGANLAQGFVLAPAGRSQAHHDVMSFEWQRLTKDGGRAVATGCDLLMLDAHGRIRCDYRYDEPVVDRRARS